MSRKISKWECLWAISHSYMKMKFGWDLTSEEKSLEICRFEVNIVVCTTRLGCTEVVKPMLLNWLRTCKQFQRKGSMRYIACYLKVITNGKT